jgi:hypothetical protein
MQTDPTSTPAVRVRSPASTMPTEASVEPATKKARVSSPQAVVEGAMPMSEVCNIEDMSVDALDAHDAPAAVTAGPSTIASAKKTPQGKARRPKKAKRPPPPEPCSPEDVVARDVAAVLGSDVVAQAEQEGTVWDAPFAHREEVMLRIEALSSNGKALS